MERNSEGTGKHTDKGAWGIYNDFSGIDFMVWIDEICHPEMKVQAVWYCHSGGFPRECSAKHGELILRSTSPTGIQEHEKFDLHLYGKIELRDDSPVMTMIIKGCKIMEPVIVNKKLTFTFEKIVPWRRNEEN